MESVQLLCLTMVEYCWNISAGDAVAWAQPKAEHSRGEFRETTGGEEERFPAAQLL